MVLGPEYFTVDLQKRVTGAAVRRLSSMNNNFPNSKMKRNLLRLSVVPAMFIVSTAMAVDDTERPPPPRNQQVLEQFDADGDGKLSAAERETARASMQGQGGRGGMNRKEMMGRFDTDGDGVISDVERNAARAQARNCDVPRGMDRQAMKDRFDADGDGVLSQEERRAARAGMMKRFDTDGDGVISDEEHEAARAQMQGRGGKGGKGGMGKASPPAEES